MNNDPILAQLGAMQADPFRARELHRVLHEAAQDLRDLARQLARHLAITTAPPRPTGKRRSLAAGKQRERRTQACQALAEDMILQVLAHMHDAQWDPLADADRAPDPQHASLLLSLLQGDEAPTAAYEQEPKEDDAWMEP